MITIVVAEIPQSARRVFRKVFQFGVSGPIELWVGHLLFAVEPVRRGEADCDRSHGQRSGQRCQEPEEAYGHIQIDRHFFFFVVFFFSPVDGRHDGLCHIKKRENVWTRLL